MLAKPTFTMVRNPYSRVLSCYLSKIATTGREKLAAWTRFSRKFGIAPDEVPSFADFLRFVEQDDKRDPHWELQTLNLVQPAARIDRLFYIEQVDELSQWLAGVLGSGLQTEEAGRYGATDKTTVYYDDNSIARVRRIYAADFEAFGYDDDPARKAPVRPLESTPGIDGALQGLMNSVLRRSEVRVARRAAKSRPASGS